MIKLQKVFLKASGINLKETIQYFFSLSRTRTHLFSPMQKRYDRITDVIKVINNTKMRKNVIEMVRTIKYTNVCDISITYFLM